MGGESIPINPHWNKIRYKSWWCNDTGLPHPCIPPWQRKPLVEVTQTLPTAECSRWIKGTAWIFQRHHSQVGCSPHNNIFRLQAVCNVYIQNPSIYSKIKTLYFLTSCAFPRQYISPTSTDNKLHFGKTKQKIITELWLMWQLANQNVIFFLRQRQTQKILPLFGWMVKADILKHRRELPTLTEISHKLQKINGFQDRLLKKQTTSWILWYDSPIRKLDFLKKKVRFKNVCCINHTILLLCYELHYSLHRNDSMDSSELLAKIGVTNKSKPWQWNATTKHGVQGRGN